MRAENSSVIDWDCCGSPQLRSTIAPMRFAPKRHLAPAFAIFASFTVAVLATLPAARGSGLARGAHGTSRDVTLAVRLAPGFEPTHRSRSLQLRIAQAGCGPRYERAKLAWSPHRLTITLLARPHPTDHEACAAYVALLRITVHLHRQLGDRAIFDGSSSPPRLVAGPPDS